MATHAVSATEERTNFSGDSWLRATFRCLAVTGHEGGRLHIVKTFRSRSKGYRPRAIPVGARNSSIHERGTLREYCAQFRPLGDLFAALGFRPDRSSATRSMSGYARRAIFAGAHVMPPPNHRSDDHAIAMASTGGPKPSVPTASK
jgi:hypothetical protein